MSRQSRKTRAEAAAEQARYIQQAMASLELARQATEAARNRLAERYHHVETLRAQWQSRQARYKELEELLQELNEQSTHLHLNYRDSLSILFGEVERYVKPQYLSHHAYQWLEKQPAGIFDIPVSHSPQLFVLAKLLEASVKQDVNHTIYMLKLRAIETFKILMRKVVPEAKLPEDFNKSVDIFLAGLSSAGGIQSITDSALLKIQAALKAAKSMDEDDHTCLNQLFLLLQQVTNQKMTEANFLKAVNAISKPQGNIFQRIKSIFVVQRFKESWDESLQNITWDNLAQHGSASQKQLCHLISSVKDFVRNNPGKVLEFHHNHLVSLNTAIDKLELSDDQKQMYKDFIEKGWSEHLPEGFFEWVERVVLGSGRKANMKELNIRLRGAKTVLDNRNSSDAELRDTFRSLKKFSCRRRSSEKNSHSLDALVQALTVDCDLERIENEIKQFSRERYELQGCQYDELGHPLENIDPRESIQHASAVYNAKLADVEQEDALLLARLKDQVSAAMDAYKKRDGIRLFERTWHGAKGRQYAQLLLNCVNEQTHFCEACDVLIAYFQDANIKYRDHSFATYLVKELLLQEQGILYRGLLEHHQQYIGADQQQMALENEMDEGAVDDDNDDDASHLLETDLLYADRGPVYTDLPDGLAGDEWLSSPPLPAVATDSLSLVSGAGEGDSHANTEEYQEGEGLEHSSQGEADGIGGGDAEDDTESDLLQLELAASDAESELEAVPQPAAVAPPVPVIPDLKNTLHCYKEIHSCAFFGLYNQANTGFRLGVRDVARAELQKLAEITRSIAPPAA